MTLREKILKTFCVTVREINKHGGPEKFFQKYPVGGVYYGEAKTLRGENGKFIGTQYDFDTLNQLKKHSKNKLLVCADECIIRGQRFEKLPLRSLAASLSEEDAYNVGKLIGMQMNDKGVDWVLGPAIDMAFDQFMYLGSISDDPEVTAKLYRQMIRGIQAQGVCATSKHFPGLGTYFTNMHLAPGSNKLPFDKWMETYGYTYKEMFKEDVMCVMTTHVTLKSYDDELCDGFYPIATFSKKLTTDLLKGKLGFKGAVVTDALVMGGMATGDLIKETVQAFKVGADILLWPPVEAAEAIEKAILSGEIPMSRLDDALERIERMEGFRNRALKAKAFDMPDPNWGDETILDVAKRGMCMLRNDIKLLPLSKEKCKKVLIIDATDQDTCSARLLKEELESRGISADIRRDVYDEPSLVCWQDDIDELQAQYDYVIINLNAAFASQWGEPHMHIWASHLFDKKKKLIVNYGSPFFATEYFPEDPTYIEMNCVPVKETVKTLVDGILGEFDFTGKPVISRKDGVIRK